jgi:hypothetical protein
VQVKCAVEGRVIGLHEVACGAVSGKSLARTRYVVGNGMDAGSVAPTRTTSDGTSVHSGPALNSMRGPTHAAGPHLCASRAHIEAATRSGAPRRAAGALQRLAETTRASGTDWALGIEVRSRALLSQNKAADDLYREAIDRLGRTRLRVELGRAHLLYGEWLRRQRPSSSSSPSRTPAGPPSSAPRPAPSASASGPCSRASWPGCCTRLGAGSPDRTAAARSHSREGDAVALAGAG